jgi:hypothetical protein
MADRYLKVHANPWLHVDHEGRAACVIPNQDMAGRWIGATRRTVLSGGGEPVKIGGFQGYAGDEPHEIVLTEFTGEPELVRECAFIRDMIRDGALILDDPADAVRMGMPHVKTGRSALAPDPSAPPAPKAPPAQPARSKGQE